MLENRLQGFALWQARAAAEGWRIRHTETELKYKDFRDIRERPVTLKGRVDRIDENLNSRQWRVLDYKTSESAEKPETTHRRKDEWQDLQLPLYRLLVRSLGIETDVELGYIHLPGDLSRIGCSIASWDQTDLDSAEHQARLIAADILDLKIDRVARGDEMRSREFARLCQDTVIDRNISWLAEWPGRRADMC
jgi:RecB family exonuclease